MMRLRWPKNAAGEASSRIGISRSKAMHNPPATTHPIQLYGQSLPPQERSRHRAWIGLRVEALLDHYWKDRPSEAVKAEIMADWMAALEAFTRDEIMQACREWARDETTKPKPASIRSLILLERAKAIPKQRTPEPERKRATAEAVQEIIRQSGLGLKA